MWQLNLLLFTQIFLGIVIIILLHTVSKLKAQVDEITKEVKEYISFIIEDENPKDTKETKEPERGDDIESSLIQSVLGEFFP